MLIASYYKLFSFFILRHYGFTFGIIVVFFMNTLVYLFRIFDILNFAIYFSMCYLVFSYQLLAIKASWWAQMELNHRPHAYQACALTI